MKTGKTSEQYYPHSYQSKQLISSCPLFLFATYEKYQILFIIVPLRVIPII